MCGFLLYFLLNFLLQSGPPVDEKVIVLIRTPINGLTLLTFSRTQVSSIGDPGN